MPFYDVIVRSDIWIEADNRQEAENKAAHLLFRSWENMALGRNDIPGGRDHTVSFTPIPKRDDRQRVTDGEVNENT